MKKEFYSNGKLLLTGEYVVLDGASALALPTKKGQSLNVETTNSGYLIWESFDCYNQSWYQTKIKTANFLKKEVPLGTSKFDDTLFKILWQAQQLNPLFLNSNAGYTIQTYLTFERLWGLGTSSTLINNIAQWAQINAFELLELSFGGSGYDIACAQNNSSIIYQRNLDRKKPKINTVHFNPAFKEQLFFVYLNKKKDSKEAILAYQKLDMSLLEIIISEINNLTDNICNSSTLTNFEDSIIEHEQILSQFLNIPTVKESHFSNYQGAIKSLGGWGGDFILATGNSTDILYFKKRGYSTIIPYKDMIL